MTEDQMTQQARAMTKAWFTDEQAQQLLNSTRALDDNDLLRRASAWCDYAEQERGMWRKVEALAAFAALCVLLYLALHVGVVVP